MISCSCCVAAVGIFRFNRKAGLVSWGGGLCPPLSSQSLLRVPRMKTDFRSRAFSSAAPQIRNHTPTAIRASASLDSFRHHLKTHYLPRHNSHHAPIATPRSSDLIFNFRVLPNFYVTLQQNSVSNASDLPRPRLRHFTVR